MKRLIRSSSGRSDSMDHQNSNATTPPQDGVPSPVSFGASPRRVGRSHSLGTGAAASPSSVSSNDMSLPNSWSIQEEDLRSTDPFSVRFYSRSPNLKTTVYANLPLPSMSQFLQSEINSRSMHKGTSGRNMWGMRRRSGDASNSGGSAMYPTLEEQGSQPQSPGSSSNTKVYYFEVTMTSSGRVSRPSFDVMLGLVDADLHAAGIWPGEVPSSIGWGSNGLFVDGRQHSDASRSPSVRRFLSGDTIGCGIETGGMHRVFFTHNGRIVVQPTSATLFGDRNESGSRSDNSASNRYFPVVAFQQADGDGVLKANFGLDRRYPFRWLGDDRLGFLVQQPGGRDAGTNGQTLSMGALPNVSRSRSPSPYSGLDISIIEADPTDRFSDDNLTRSMRRLSSASINSSGRDRSTSTTAAGVTPPQTARYTTNTTSTTYLNTSEGSAMSGNNNLSPAVYGTRKSRRNLEDDDPSASASLDHFNMNRGSEVGGPPAWLTGGGGTRQHDIPVTSQSSTTVDGRTDSSTDVGAVSLRRLDSSRRRREERSQQRRATRSGSGGYIHQSASSSSIRIGNLTEESVGTSHAGASSPQSSSVQSADRGSHTRSDVGEGGPVVIAHVSSGELLIDSKTHSNSLLEASKARDVDFGLVRTLLDNCKKDQEKLQVKLSTALEEADAIDNLEELFAVNDGICSAIEAGNDALKKEKAKGRKKSMEGPTIEVLVQNEDIFSLICMLRAPNEKRLQAALALMDFAKDNEMLRNEIRSSGGMHSFLTLFRTRGMTRELQVVASMAVAYTLSSFVASSQTSSSVGLKIMECLRFLVTANPVSPNGSVITRDRMCQAASAGVNVLWINAIQPLIALEKIKGVSSNSKPVLNPSQSIRFGRVKSRAGGGLFDQGQESLEIQELTDSAVTLIAHLVKLSQTNQVRIDVGFNIIEQVCEIDEARPVAVREGLLSIFVDWIRSGDIDKIRPAASALRYLISIHDKYMAGWIHSQVVNEGAIKEIVKLLNESVGHDVRVAVSQMLSALCIAPHTRAAVIDANCVSYLVALLYEHTAPDSEELVYCAGSALLQLSACSMMAGATGAGVLPPLENPETSSKQADVVNEIVEGWAHGSFVQIALEHDGKLRSVSIEALRILSEDTNPSRRTRLQLCSAGAAEALGSTIKNYESAIQPLEFDHLDSSMCATEGPLLTAIKDTYEALCGLANILEPLRLYSSRKAENERRMSGIELNPKELLVKGCMDTAKSGGLRGILWVSALPYVPSALSENETLSFDRTDLLEESCRLLANLSPLLLSETASSEGVTRWASDVFEALDGILKRVNESDGDVSMRDSGSVELNINALKGIMALAFYEPLKIKIVNRALPRLLSLKGMSDERNDLATAANQVLLSLGFTEDEITVQVAGNSPQLLVDWFCLQRALLLQAMARAEIRARVLDLWQLPFSETNTEKLEEMALIRQISARTDGSNTSSCGSEDDPVIKELFSSFTRDYDSRATIATVTKQYHDVYEVGGSRRVAPGIEIDRSNDTKEDDHMSLHAYPLNDVNEEMDWILQHRQTMEMENAMQKFSVTGLMPERVEKLLDSCFPSKLLRANIVPVNDLLPGASFNFRALMMPKRRYFSFRREGQLLARLCDKQAKDIDSDDVHWTLGFTNSTFAGEFVESLVQSLYLCPMISGLSFARSSEWMMMSDAEREGDSDEGGGLLANLTGSLPPWVSHLTFDNMLNDRDLRALVAILETMGRLSSGPENDGDASQISIGQSQGKFSCFCIRNSLQISREVWSAFFQTLGKVGPAKRNLAPSPLASLKILDLSGNKMGDEAAAMVLELVHDKDSGCTLEQLDLSGNRIGRGSNVIRVLCAYTEYYRYNQTVGVKMMRKGWKSSLHTLSLAENDLFLGQAGLEILALLKHNALCVRYLDLSNNSLEGDTYQLLASSLLKNTALCHLNLSGNKFSPALIDLVLDHLDDGDAESGLSFLLFENNTPAMNEGHRAKLAKFLRRSRKNAIVRYIKESEADSANEGEMSERQGGDLELIDEDTSKILSRRSFDGNRRRHIAHEVEVEAESNMITVLFSAPLVFSSGENELHPFAKLDFEMERELLWQCMKEASRDIDMAFDNAHHSRLLATLTKRCSVLHYSGHGHPTFLPFEDGMGGPNWLDVQDIKELILQDGVVPFKFVFVSACHSGLAGETFASAGVPHVVCCKQESELKDAAALAFTRSFYLALLVGHTVKESFEQGCKAVRATPNLKDPDKEMEKFVLLPKDGNHHVPVFRAKPIREWPKQQRTQGMLNQRPTRRRGSRSSLLTRMKSTMALGAKSSELSVRNMMQDDPSPTAPQFFLGREVDMYYIISTLLKLRKRLVTIIGETGIGRSSLACAICHYINERASTISDIQHIYFIKPKHGGQNVSCRSILRQLLDKLEENGKCRPIDEDVDTEAMLNTICRSLKQDKCLIVFDRTELLEKSDESQEMPMILSTILYETKMVKVIITARNPLGQPSIGGQVEHPYTLGPLTFANAVKLFANLCPHLHTPSERGQLSKTLVRDEDQEELLPTAATINDRTKSVFSIIGDGIPAKIEKCAYSISLDDLSRLQEF